MKVKSILYQVYYDLEKQQLLEELQDEDIEEDNVIDESEDSQEERKEKVLENK